MNSPAKPGMKRSRTPWTAKLRPGMEPEVAADPKGRGQMLFPTPALVAEEISTIPPGALVTVSALRLRMARRFQADLACPLMTGIFYNIIAGAAEEQLAAGLPPLAPYWRVILDDGTLSPKTPGGPEHQAERLRQEGHLITPRRTRLLVTDYQQHLAP
ncbi:MAG: 6-O-methylguanine DNA methyltransferase [Verrucomicrobiota bacterium]